MPNDDFDMATIDRIQSYVNHKNCNLDDIQHLNMFLLSIKTLLKKASKGNLKAQRLKLYNDNLHRGLADVLEHSDLQSCQNKTETVS